MSSIDGVLSVECDTSGGYVHAKIGTESSRDIREELFFRFADAKLPILSMNYEEVTLEKVFLELTGETNITAGTNNSAEKKSLEEEFAEKAVENMKNSAEASAETGAGRTGRSSRSRKGREKVKEAGRRLQTAVRR